MTTATTLFSFGKPVVGADADVWGTELNTIFDSIDKLLGAITTGGSANAYTLTSGQSLAAYASGQRFCVKWSFSNTGSATINVDGLGAKTLKKRDASTNLSSGDATINTYAIIVYDGTNFVVLGTLTSDYQPLDATLTALAALSTSAGQYLRATGTDTFTMDSYATVLGNINAPGLGSVNTFGARQIISTSTPILDLNDTGASANNKKWWLAVSSGIFEIITVDDAISTSNVAFQITRSGATPLVASLGSGVDLVLATTAPTATGSAGFRGGGPPNVKTADYTTAVTDEGRALDMNSAGAHAITVKASTHTANAELFGVNMGAGVLTLTRDTGVTFRDQTGTNTNVTVNQYQNWYARRDPSTDNLWYVRVG